MSAADAPPLPRRDTAEAARAAVSRRRRGVMWSTPAIAVFVATIVAAGALALVSRHLYTSDEQRLLRLRVREAASLVSSAIPDLQAELAAAAALANATGGDVTKFRRLVAPFTGPGRSFVSVSLWRVDRLARGPLTVVGAPAELAREMGSAASFFARAARTPRLNVTGLLSAAEPRLGYVYGTSPGAERYVAYAESSLPRGRRSRYQSSSAFSDLDYALYLGAAQRPAQLLLTDVRRLPFRSRHFSQRIPFGDTELTLVMSPRASLSGSLPQRLPLVVAVVGVLLAAGAAALTLRLSRRRQDAERLAAELERAAAENRQLYAEQRGIAQTLQHALLPEQLPRTRRIESSASYVAGEQGLEIGGDWYDLIDQGEGRMLLVVGDVSGRGLRAATTMASLRYAIRAYAAQRDLPAAILTKLSSLVTVARDGQLATVLCALLDVERGELQLTSAGHLPPLLITAAGAEYPECAVGLPIGVDAGAEYASRTVAIPAVGTVLAFTDGLVERRGESLDDGLARLRAAATTARGEELAQLLARLVAELHSGAGSDDTAIVGLRWTS